MSYLSDALSFESFALKDLWKGIKKDPERLLLGAVGPWSSKLWGKALGKDYEPLLDQMGGPYGGHTVSAFGAKDGGVYQRARDAGYSTDEAGSLHDAAHVIGAFYGGQGIGGIGSGGGAGAGAAAAPVAGGGAGAASGLGSVGGLGAALPEIVVTGSAGGLGAGAGLAGVGAAGAAGSSGMANADPFSTGAFANGGQGGMAGVGGGNAGTAAQAGVIPGGAGAGSATGGGGLGSLSTQDYIRMAGQAMPQGGDIGGQANAQVGRPQMQPSMGQRINGGIDRGLGKLGSALLPIDPRVAATMDPAYLKQMQSNALMQAGLGMMSNASQGGRFGEALATGLGAGQAGFGRNIENAYEKGVIERAEKRATDREAGRDARYDAEQSYQRERDQLGDSRWQTQFDEQKRQRDEDNSIARERMRQETGLGRVPMGYRLSASGNLEFIPGGPADPAFGAKPARPTDSDRKARLLFGEMADAEKQYTDVAGKGDASVWDSALDSNPMTRVFTSEDFRKREASGLRWAQNFLYLKSGASATNEEVRKTFVQYLPQPGDTEAVIEQKAEARAQALQNVAAANSIEMPGQPSSAPTLDDIRKKYGR